MKQLTKKEIQKAFEEVTDQDFKYGEETNLITLKGTFCSDELRCIADRMDSIFHGDKELARIKNLNIKGFTAKDIKVIYDCQGERDRNNEKEYRFSFYIMKDGKDWDFYYGQSDEGAGDWWPEPEDPIYQSPITEFIPSGFAEACENMYEYHGPLEEGVQLLKDCGFTVEKGEDY